MAKRKPTAAERRQWEQDIQKVDIDADRADIVAQVNEGNGMQEAIERLKAWRESQGISLRALEESSGIPRGNLSRLENHLHSPSLSTLQQYAEALGKAVRVVVVDG